MSKPRVFSPNQPNGGSISKNSRGQDAREQSSCMARPHVEPSHQHNHDKKMQSMRRVKRAK